eukprot:2475228-Prorocentrum_lima.AAC.1
MGGDPEVRSSVIIDEDVDLVCVTEQLGDCLYGKRGEYGVHDEHSCAFCVGVLSEMLFQGLFWGG